MGKITMDNLSESLIEKLKVDLTGVNEIIDEIDKIVRDVDTLLKDDSTLKNELINALNDVGCNATEDNTIGELFVMIENIKVAKGDARENDVLKGKVITDKDGNVITGTINQVDTSSLSVTPGSSDKTLTSGYYPNDINVTVDANLVAKNIKNDVTIFGITGTSYTAI